MSFSASAGNEQSIVCDGEDNAQAKIPRKTVKTKERTFDANTGKTKVRLHFEEVDKPNPPSKLEHGIKKAPERAALSAVHKKISDDEQDSVRLEASHSTEKAGEFVAPRVQSACGRSYCKEYLDYICADSMGNLIRPGYMTSAFPILFKSTVYKRYAITVSSTHKSSTR